MKTSKSAQAVEWMLSTPGATQELAANKFGITQSAISLRLMRHSGGSKAVSLEREACACIAEAMGSLNIAEVLRSRSYK